MHWGDPHYQEWAETEAVAARQWIGRVRRRREGPAQLMSGETRETLWCSAHSDTEADALQKATERIEHGPPWEPCPNDH